MAVSPTQIEHHPGRMGSSAGARSLAAGLARDIVDVVGDTCVVRLLERGLKLALVAADQRVPSSQIGLSLLNADPLLDVRAGWNGQAVRKNTTVRLDDVTWDELSGAPTVIGSDARRVRGLIVPLRGTSGVIGTVTVARDAGDQPYSLAEQLHLERVVARAGAGLAPLAGGKGAVLSATNGLAAPPPPERLLELSAVGIWVTDRKARTVYANESACELLGRPASELEGRPMGDFLDEEPQSVYRALHPGPERGDHEIVRPDGTVIWAAMRSTPWLDEDGNWCGTVNALADITERKEAEIRQRLRTNAQYTLADMAVRALRGERLDDLLQGAVEAVADVLGLDLVSIGEWIGPRRMRALSSVGWNDDDLEELAVFDVPAERPQQLAADFGESVVIREYGPGASFGAIPVLERKGVCSSVYVAIGRKGVIGAHSTEPRELDPEEVGFVESLAALLEARWTEAAYAVA
jgi:PAS domain S-box-containing protein